MIRGCPAGVAAAGIALTAGLMIAGRSRNEPPPVANPLPPRWMSAQATPTRWVSGEFGYIHKETTGHTEYVVINGKEIPAIFDAEGSDRQALSSLQALGCDVLGPNSDGKKITLFGEYSAQTFLNEQDYRIGFQDDLSVRVIRVRHWRMKTPFLQWDDSQDARTEIGRSSLKRSDFTSGRYIPFNPDDPSFDPHAFEGNGRPAGD